MPKSKQKRYRELVSEIDDAGDFMAFVRRQRWQAAVGKACGTTRQAISQWSEVPANRVLVIEKTFGVPRHLIRPDLYPPKDYAFLTRFMRRGSRPSIMA